MPITVRSATPDDVPQLADLAEATFRETFVEGFAVGYPEADLGVFLQESYAPGRVAAWIADPRAQVLVAEDEHGRLVGYTHSGDNTLPYPLAEAGDGELKRIYVRRAVQGSGVGRELMERALRWLGDRTILIGVWSLNLKAQRLYARYGFDKVGEYRFMVGGTADEEFILRRGPRA
jgi:ribosomal protein S18 acetylase RimI-like enzyme